MGAIFRNFLREKKKRAKLYVTSAVCAVLIAAQVTCAVLFFRFFPLAAVLVSNALTVALMIPAIRCFASLYEELAGERDDAVRAQAAASLHAEEARLQQIQGLQERNDALSAENRTLQGRLETRSQLDAVPHGIHFVFRLETMEYLKTGYVVKKEPLYPARETKELSLDVLRNPFSHDSSKEILYVHKYYYKASIGIDFSAIRYAIRDGQYMFHGVQFKKLHDLTSECEPEETDINFCEVRLPDREKVKRHLGERDSCARESFEKNQSLYIKRQLDEDVAEKCRLYTKVFRESLCHLYAGLLFVDAEDELEGMQLYSLDASSSPYVSGIAAAMLMLATVIQETCSIDNSLPGERM